MDDVNIFHPKKKLKNKKLKNSASLSLSLLKIQLKHPALVPK
jgi:hypothetical protein